MSKLKPTSRSALRVIYSRGVVRGRDLMRFTNLTPAQLREALQTLTREKFVTVKSNRNLALDEDVLDAYIAPLPSRQSEAMYEMEQAD